MNLLLIFICFSTLFYLYNFENKSIIFISSAILFYIYYNKLLPETYWKLPEPINTNDKFTFTTLDKLINKYNKSKGYEKDLIEKDIQKEINTIYFSFPTHQHKDISNFLYLKYNFN